MNIFLADILLVTGTLVLIVAFITYQILKIEQLKQHGRRIIATITSIRYEPGKSFGLTRDNYYVTAKWTNPRTGSSYTFWTWIVNARLNYRQGDLVPVLIDPNHPQRYTMVL
ncbi:MAG TPA: DUF3592 domain-containing protein [Ktedonobacteraceae bacterium]|nr:DUF3592 domain-containing protein [Ktedonobacteraceae bacterium]